MDHWGRLLLRVTKLCVSFAVSFGDGVQRRALSLLGLRPPPVCVVLYYHGVPARAARRFRRQMDTLLRSSTPVRADAIGPLAPGRRYTAVTFDDGFVSVVENALPVLRARRIPCTLFVPTGCLGSHPSWIANGHPDGHETVISPTVLARLSTDGLVTIGSHSVTHPDFRTLGDEAAREELARSKADLERIVGKHVDLFSFPHGATDSRTLEFARLAGYTRVFTIEATRAASVHDRFALGRVRVDPADWPVEFRLKVTGAYRWLPHASAWKRRVLDRLRWAGPRPRRSRIRSSDEPAAVCPRDASPPSRPRAAAAATSAPRVSPVTEADVDRVAQFLNTHLNRRVPAAAWAQALRPPWHVDAPNHGFMLLHDRTVVGVQLAFYSERMIGGRREPFCNLGAWCVLPGYRSHSLRLLLALLAQDRYHFTDLSPSGSAVAVNRRLGFRFLDTTTVLIPNLPWPSWPTTTIISSDPALIERTLPARQRELFRDHARARAAHHLVLISHDESCYVIFRKDRRKHLPLFASLLHVSNPYLLLRAIRPLGRHLLLHYGTLATLVELRLVTRRPPLSVLLRSPRRKMFKSPRLEPDDIDNLYSELVCVAW